MTKTTADKVSMLVDDELDEQEMHDVIQSMRSDGDLRSCWEGYHLIGDALRGGLPRYLPIDLADRVASALENEPAFLSPRPTAPESPSPSPAPATVRKSNAFAGFALAASMSAIAVFGMMTLDRGPDGMPGEMAAGQPTLASVAPSPVPHGLSTMPPLARVSNDLHAGGGGAATESVVVAPDPAFAKDATVLATADYTFETGTADAGSRRQPPVAPDLYDYLVNYHRYAAVPAESGDMLSYVRMVSYEPAF